MGSVEDLNWKPLLRLQPPGSALPVAVRCFRSDLEVFILTELRAFSTRCFLLLSCALTMSAVPTSAVEKADLPDIYVTYQRVLEDHADARGGVDDQARIFLSQNRNFRIEPEKNTVYLSSIFKWYKKDFAAGDIPIEKIPKLGFEETAVIRIRYLKYDWSLNEKQQP